MFDRGNTPPTLILFRGLPGSGKTTLATLLCDVAFAADDYFVNDAGDYVFDGGKIKDAHAYCKRRTVEAMRKGVRVVGVHNTFTRCWEMRDYFDAAERFGYRVSVVTCEGDHGNEHGVPDTAIRRMADRWETFDPRISE